MRAYCLIREAPVYRRDAFNIGLARAGYEVINSLPREAIYPGDVLCIWNRYREFHDVATQFENAGHAVIVAENGYIGPHGISPHGMLLRAWFALARSFHNDDTVIAEGDASRWNALGVELQPWHQDGGHILVCPNRSFGTPGRFMPIGWGDDVAQRLKKFTKREVRIRPHPGNNPPAKLLAEDLAGAHACVIWASSAGVHALIAGVPVICEAPFWICKSAAYDSLDFVLTEKPEYDIDRERALRRLAWAQWSLAEVESGEALDYLLRTTREGEVRAAD